MVRYLVSVAQKSMFLTSAFLLDSHDSVKWLKTDICTELSYKLKVPVTIDIITDSTLLDRDGLVSNPASTKPVYIQKL